MNAYLSTSTWVLFAVWRLTNVEEHLLWCWIPCHCYWGSISWKAFSFCIEILEPSCLKLTHTYIYIHKSYHAWVAFTRSIFFLSIPYIFTDIIYHRLHALLAVSTLFIPCNSRPKSKQLIIRYCGKPTINFSLSRLWMDACLLTMLSR
jgi:hypothetical protein